MAYGVIAISSLCLYSIWSAERSSVALSPFIFSPIMVPVLALQLL